MQKKILALSLAVGLILSLAACGSAGGATSGTPSVAPTPTPSASPTVTPSIPAPDVSGATEILLADGGSTVDGSAISADPTAAVYSGAPIVYYETGRDATYGEGTEADGHTAEEAAAHTVVTITQPGVYRVSGKLSAGQLAVDLGEEAKDDPTAVVTLLLDGADITCTVAPGLIFYNVYECGSTDPEAASPTVDTAAAGANVVIADGSENVVNGSYVARIYKEGTDEKLHKYDGAFYSKMSMNIFGQDEGTGTLTVNATNEGLDSELHLTINGGMIDIVADNDGINTNEDGVSVTTINGGYLTVSGGLGAEGDGIDSNGYLVVNGGTLISYANGKAGEGGIDSDSGIYLNGGTVLALGSRNDEAQATSGQSFIQLSFIQSQTVGSAISLQNSDGQELLYHVALQEFSSVTFSAPDLKTGETYALYVDGVQQQYTGNSFGMGGGTPPDMGDGTGTERPQLPSDGVLPTDGSVPTDRPQRPDDAEGMTPPDGTAAPDASSRPTGGGRGGSSSDQGNLEPSTAFALTAEVYSFSGISGVTP